MHMFHGASVKPHARIAMQILRDEVDQGIHGSTTKFLFHGSGEKNLQLHAQNS